MAIERVNATLLPAGLIAMFLVATVARAQPVLRQMTVPPQGAVPMAAVAGIVSPHVVVIRPTLVTSGQPGRESLRNLRSEGYDAVISLTPANARIVVSDEAELLKAQGIEFVHIPIPWEKPEAKHLEAAAAALRRLEGKKVLVHCEMNRRASAITFLYRTVYAKEDPVAAWGDVKRVWTPEGQWAAFINEQLRAGGVRFEAK
jgi:protein tyrosine phosphatase (PTP) superfamily phosphohydrolase (DUF442 family)